MEKKKDEGMRIEAEEKRIASGRDERTGVRKGVNCWTPEVELEPAEVERDREGSLLD